MNNQGKFFIALTVLLVILLVGGGIMGFIYWQNQSADTETIIVNENKNTQAVNQNTETSININAVEEEVISTGPIDEETYIQQLAKSFTERYGSFSNQNDYENLLDLKIYMTQKMQKETDEFIAANQKESTGNEEYYGVTTKVLSLKKLSLEGDQAVYSAICQRKESQGLTGSSQTTQATAKIEFKKVDGQWKVYSLTWL